MKVILVILAGLFALLAGGCAIAVGGNLGPMGLPLVAIAIANVVLIFGVIKSASWVPWLLWIFAVIDLIVAAVIAFTIGNDPYVGPIAIFVAIILALKAVAEGVSAYRIGNRQPPSGGEPL